MADPWGVPSSTGPNSFVFVCRKVPVSDFGATPKGWRPIPPPSTPTRNPESALRGYTVGTCIYSLFTRPIFNLIRCTNMINMLISMINVLYWTATFFPLSILIFNGVIYFYLLGSVVKGQTCCRAKDATAASFARG